MRRGFRKNCTKSNGHCSGVVGLCRRNPRVITENVNDCEQVPHFVIIVLNALYVRQIGLALGNDASDVDVFSPVSPARWTVKSQRLLAQEKLVNGPVRFASNAQLSWATKKLVDINEGALISRVLLKAPQRRRRLVYSSEVQLSATRNSKLTDEALLTMFVIRKVSVKQIK